MKDLYIILTGFHLEVFMGKNQIEEKNDFVLYNIVLALVFNFRNR